MRPSSPACTEAAASGTATPPQAAAAERCVGCCPPLGRAAPAAAGRAEAAEPRGTPAAPAVAAAELPRATGWPPAASLGAPLRNLAAPPGSAAPEGQARGERGPAAAPAPAVGPAWGPPPAPPGAPLQNLAAPSGAAPRRAASQAPLQGAAAAAAAGEEVILQVYDLLEATRFVGLSVFHLAVEVRGREYFFSTRGICCCAPGSHTGHIFREAVPIGRTPLSDAQIELLLVACLREWTGDTYNVLTCNCQTFALAFCEMLRLPPGSIPPQYCQLSGVGESALGATLAAALRPLLSSQGSLPVSSRPPPESLPLSSGPCLLGGIASSQPSRGGLPCGSRSLGLHPCAAPLAAASSLRAAV